MLDLLVAIAFQIDPSAQAQRELTLRMQMHQLMENPRLSIVKKQREEARDAAVRDYFFAQKFNKLVDKLKQFTVDYNAGKVDAKTVAELKKAWRSLEKDEGWLHEPKEKRKKEEKTSSEQEAAQACGAT